MAGNPFSVLEDRSLFCEDGSPRPSTISGISESPSPCKDTAPVPVNMSTPITDATLDDSEIKLKLNFDQTITDDMTNCESPDNTHDSVTMRIIDPLWLKVYTIDTFSALCTFYLLVNKWQNLKTCQKRHFPCINRFYVDSDGKSACQECISEKGDKLIFRVVQEMETPHNLQNIVYPNDFNKNVDLDLFDESSNEDTSGSKPQSGVDTSTKGVNAPSPSPCDRGRTGSECPDTSGDDQRSDGEDNTQEGFQTVKPKRSTSKSVRSPTSQPLGANGANRSHEQPTRLRHSISPATTRSANATSTPTAATPSNTLYFPVEARRVFKSYAAAFDCLWQEQRAKIAFECVDKPIIHVKPKTPADKAKLLALTTIGGHDLRLTNKPPPITHRYVATLRRNFGKDDLFAALPGATGFKRIHKLLKGEHVPMPKVEFNFPGEVPDKILVKGYQCSVSKLNTKLSRCFKCQKYGHLGEDCRGRPNCGRCSGPHITKGCQSNKIKCVNCGKDGHPAYANSCPKRQQILQAVHKKPVSVKTNPVDIPPAPVLDSNHQFPPLSPETQPKSYSKAVTIPKQVQVLTQTATTLPTLPPTTSARANIAPIAQVPISSPQACGSKTGRVTELEAENADLRARLSRLENGHKHTRNSPADDLYSDLREMVSGLSEQLEELKNENKVLRMEMLHLHHGQVSKQNTDLAPAVATRALSNIPLESEPLVPIRHSARHTQPKIPALMKLQLTTPEQYRNKKKHVTPSAIPRPIKHSNRQLANNKPQLPEAFAGAFKMLQELSTFFTKNNSQFQALY